MDYLVKNVEPLLRRTRNDVTLDEYRRLIKFLDASLAEAYQHSGDERAKFLVSSMLSVRDYLYAEVILESTKEQLSSEVINTIEQAAKNFEWTKKKEEPEEVETDPVHESLLVKDLETS